jgi:hypothetical protein
MIARLVYPQEMKLSLALALLASTAVWAADPVPMDVKTGEWEYTVTMQMAGMQMPQTAKQTPQLTPEQLAQIPAAQRAQVEAMMKQGANPGAPRTTTNKNCVKKEDLAKLNPRDDKTCKMTLVGSSRNKQEIKMDCDSNGSKQTGTMVIEALSSESTKFNIQAAANQNGQPMNMTINGTGKWLSATCTDSK